LISGIIGDVEVLFASQLFVGGISKFVILSTFVTLEGTRYGIVRKTKDVNKEIREWTASKRWRLVDGASCLEVDTTNSENAYPNMLHERSQRPFRKIISKRFPVNFARNIFMALSNPSDARNMVRRFSSVRENRSITSCMIFIRMGESGDITCHGAEQLVVDNVSALWYALENNSLAHNRDFEALRNLPLLFYIKGIVIVFLSSMKFARKLPIPYKSSGVIKLRNISRSIFYYDFIILVAGVALAGKMPNVTDFMITGASGIDKSFLFISYENTRQFFCMLQIGDSISVS
jgi:KaiC/GvpD/RAD55 family RecA-like ATPase